jgi:hypothetical protein
MVNKLLMKFKQLARINEIAQMGDLVFRRWPNRLDHVPNGLWAA